jgi:hypothetical protein
MPDAAGPVLQIIFWFLNGYRSISIISITRRNKSYETFSNPKSTVLAMQGNYKKNKEFSSNINRCRIIFLVWDRESIRAYGISKHIGASLHFLFTSRIRHPVLFFRTLQILRRKRPQIIICQSPPLSCAFMALVYKFLFAPVPRPKILIDFHTAALTKPRSKILNALIMKFASVIIVTNKELQNDVIQNYQVKPIVLEDPIPDLTSIVTHKRIQDADKLNQRKIFKVAVISSYAPDEPLQEVFDAASELADVQFFITGDKRYSNKKLLTKKSNNIIMTGFLDYKTYVELLQDVDVIMDLTTDDKTLVAGAYEAVALERPLIISDWMPLRRYFNKGTIYVKNSPKDIREAILTARIKKEELSRQMHQLKAEKIKEWNDTISKFYYLLSDGNKNQG